MMLKGLVPFGLRTPALLRSNLRQPHQLACPTTTITASSRSEAASSSSSGTYNTPSPSSNTLDVRAADGPPAMRLLALEGNIERAIYACRFMAIFGVAGSLMGSVVCFLKGCTYVMNSFTEYLVGSGKLVMILVEAIDIYLIGTVMLVFGMGLYELFISSIDIENSPDGSNMLGFFKLQGRPEWLEIKSVNQLKTKLGHVIVTVLLVGLLEKSKKVTISSSTDLLCFAMSILLSSACLYLLSKLHTPKQSKHDGK